MKTGSMGLVFVSLACASTALAATTVPLNIKTGLWDMTYVTTITGAPSLPKEVMDKLPPARKAQMLARMGAQGAPKTRTEKKCFTQKDLDEAVTKFNSESDPDCKHDVTKSTSTHLEGTFTCTGHDAASGTMKMDAPTPESVKSEVNTTSGTMKVNMVISGKWLSSDCGKVK